jgi:membrane associated rhomboid family serine protease
MIRVRDGDDEHILSMDEFERRARRGEISPHAMVSIPALTGDDGFVEARTLSLFSAVYDPRRLLFRRHFQLGRLPLVTTALTVLCIALWWVARDLGDGAVTREALLALGAKARARIVDEGETWRLLTASVLHKDGVHLGFNLFVLVSVGSVLEAVYRRGDYMLLLVCSGLSCMVTSTIASPPATVGASGMVFGCLGCAVVFGLRFADVLSLRYRLYFGVVLVAYTAAAFWSGLLRTSTDNWGHAGGMACGFLFGALLEPRLLRLKGVRETRTATAQPWIAVVVVMLMVVVSGPLLPRLLLRWVPLPFDAFGVVLHHPQTWARGPDPLGFVAVGNGTDALASLACSRSSTPAALDQAATIFVDRELFGLMRAGHIANLEVDPQSDDIIDQRARIPARRVAFSFIASDGPFHATARVFVRGEIECALVTAARNDASATSMALLQRLVDDVEIVSTLAERKAVAASERSTSTKAWLERALAHQAAGSVDEARAAFVQAQQFATTETSWLVRVNVARARFELAQGRQFDAAASAIAAAVATSPDDADVRAVVVDVALARGERELACIERLAARARFRDDARFAATKECP